MREMSPFNDLFLWIQQLPKNFSSEESQKNKEKRLTFQQWSPPETPPEIMIVMIILVGISWTIL